jgi:hypothetical protein
MECEERKRVAKDDQMYVQDVPCLLAECNYAQMLTFKSIG